MKKVRSKRTRYSLAVTIGITAGLITALFMRWEYALLVSWDVAALVIFLVIALDMKNADAEKTSVVAHRDDMSHSLSDAVVLTASLISLTAVLYMLVSNDTSVLYLGFGIISIVISWATVHMLYALRYAAMYYSDPKGGIYFNCEKEPRFSDFAYVAFTLGMSYQVTDNKITTYVFRRVILKHALLSFIFNTTIIATTINFLVSLSK